MTLEDKMKSIAYCSKDICRRQAVNNISQEVITQSCKFYYASQKSQPETTKGWTIINGKNFHIKLENFATKNSMTVHDYELIPRMTHERHTFQMSSREQKKYLAELKFAHKNYDVLNPELNTIMEFDEFDDSPTNPTICYFQEKIKLLEELNSQLKEENSQLKYKLKQ